MSDAADRTALERVSGSLVTESALTVLVAIAGGPLAPLLPVLTKSLAAERQRKRVEQALGDIGQVLRDHEAQIRDLSDEQYKVINESVLALFQTTHEDKLKYLRAAVKNAFQLRDIAPQESIALSRVVRDISADEVAYLMRTFQYAGIHLFAAPEDQKFTDNILRVNPKSQDALLVSGLLSLGLLVPAESTYGAPNVLRFSNVAAKLLALLKSPDA